MQNDITGMSATACCSLNIEMQIIFFQQELNYNLRVQVACDWNWQLYRFLKGAKDLAVQFQNQNGRSNLVTCEDLKTASVVSDADTTQSLATQNSHQKALKPGMNSQLCRNLSQCHDEIFHLKKELDTVSIAPKL